MFYVRIKHRNFHINLQVSNHWCNFVAIMVRGCINIWRILVGIMALNVAIVLVGIPISFALHTHSQVDCESGHGHSHHQAPGKTSDDCELCVFYAYFVPKNTDSWPIFSFDAPSVSRTEHRSILPSENASSAFLGKYTTRGPPIDLV